MKTRFDWQTEEDGEFEQTRSKKETPSPKSKTGCLVLSLIIASIAISSLIWLLNRRQSDTISRIREDVIFAFELQKQAVENEDRELFSTTLSSSDRAWRREKERLLAANLVGNLSEIGLVTDAGSQTQTRLKVSPNLREAELSYVQSYLTAVNTEVSSQIELSHTLVYHLEDGRWMNASTDPSFWGEWKEIDGGSFSITYPERDAELARRLADKIDSRLRKLCLDLHKENHYGEMLCEGVAPWRIKLSTNTASLQNFSKTPSRASIDYDYELPAPSLVGIPLLESDYETYLRIYTTSLMRYVDEILLTTRLLPDQHIYALCFDHPLDGKHIYRYEWPRRSWQPLLPFQTFNYLIAYPDDSAVLISEGKKLTVFDASPNTEPSGHAEIWQRSLPSIDAQQLIGWISAGESPHHLVQQATDNAAQHTYKDLDFQNCDQTQCLPLNLPGFPSWAPEGEAAIYLNGPEIFIGNKTGERLRLVGTGFAPFWVNDDTFGYVRFARSESGAATTEVVIRDLDSNEVQVLFDGDDLAQEAGINQESNTFVNYVIPNPIDPDTLIVSSTGIREYSGRYYIFTADISQRSLDPPTPRLALQLTRKGSQGGVPGLLAPTGPAPFLVSPNGRWLAITELQDHIGETWTILVHDLQNGTSRELSKNVPAMPGNFPLLDWSSDGQWLLVADREYLHLVAPQFEREEIIAHSFDACSHIAWAD